MARTRTQPFRDIATILGGVALLGTEPGTQVAFADRVAKGLPVESLVRLKEELHLTEIELCALVGISPRTFARLKAAPCADPLVSDRAYRLAYLLAKARALFGEAGAVAWLKTAQRGVGGRVPLELAATEAGAREVEALIHRLEHGVYT